MSRYKVILHVDDDMVDVQGEYESEPMRKQAAERHVDKFRSFVGVEPEMIRLNEYSVYEKYDDYRNYIGSVHAFRQGEAYDRAHQEYGGPIDVVEVEAQ